MTLWETLSVTQAVAGGTAQQYATVVLLATLSAILQGVKINGLPNEEAMACYIDGLLSKEEKEQVEKHI